MVPRGAFTVPLLLVCAVSAITVFSVPAPENVTLSCNNLKTTASWEYGDRAPGTSFIVDIVSSDGSERQETSELHFDLSSFVWESLPHYTAFHSVNVMAVRQQQRSKPVGSNSLTFNTLKHASVHCLLDFPPVNLTMGESGRTVSFKNPFLFYEELRGAKKSPGVSFEFSVSSNSSNEPSEYVSCPLSQTICRYDLSSSEDMDECVVLNGRLNDGKKLFYVDFRQTEPVCPTQAPEDHLVLVAVSLTILLCVFIAVIGLAVKCVLNEQAHVKDTPTPRPLVAISEQIMGTRTYKPETEETQLIWMVREEEGTTSGDLCQHEASVSSGDLDSMETDSFNTKEEEEEEEEEIQEDRGHYDCGHMIHIGNGDMVQGYK